MAVSTPTPPSTPFSPFDRTKTVLKKRKDPEIVHFEEDEKGESEEGDRKGEENELEIDKGETSKKEDEKGNAIQDFHAVTIDVADEKDDDDGDDEPL